MSTTAPPPLPRKPGPLIPPDEQFWEKYSPHYEFPLSTVGSIALHIAALVMFLAALWMLARMTGSEKNQVTMASMNVIGDGTGDPAAGSGGQRAPEEALPAEQNTNPRPVPDKPLDPVVKDQLKDIFPVVSTDADAPRIEDLKLPQQLEKLEEGLRRRLLDGMSKKKGTGTGEGSGPTDTPGKGSNTIGDPTSSQNRSVRWALNFKTLSGKDHLNQLAAMKATIVIPFPPDWKTSKAFRNLENSPPTVEPFRIENMNGVYFVDDSAESASRLAKALGLDFDPPVFLAFFPKDVEEELAAKERAFRGRKEREIFSTEFQVLMRDGKPSITVIAQVPVKR